MGRTFDLQTVAAHEIGHALGLGHSKDNLAEMYGTYAGARTGLGTDDVAGVRSIYSSGSARSPDAYDAAASNNTATTATDITSAVDPASYTATLTGLDITTTSDVDFYQLSGTVPTGTNSLTVKVQSQGFSLLSPVLTVYAADKTTVLGTASGAGQYGATLTVTVGSGIGTGQPVYIKVAGASTAASGTGAYALTLTTGSNPVPTATPPVTTLANGTTVHSGGGTPDSISPTPGHGQGHSRRFGQDQPINTATGTGDAFTVLPTADDDTPSPRAVPASAGQILVAWFGGVAVDPPAGPTSPTPGGQPTAKPATLPVVPVVAKPPVAESTGSTIFNSHENAPEVWWGVPVGNNVVLSLHGNPGVIKHPATH